MQNQDVSVPAGTGGDGGWRTRTAAWIIILTALTNSRAMLPVFRDHLIRYLGIDDRVYGLMFSIPAFVSLVPLLLVGWMIARWKAERVFTFSVVTLAAGFAGVAFCGASWGGLAATLAVSAVACVLVDVSAHSVLVDLFPGARRRVLALALSARSVTETLVPLLAEGLLYTATAVPAIGFAGVLHAPFGILAVVFLLSGAYLYRRHLAAGAAARWRWGDLLISRRSLYLVLLMTVHGVADGTLFTWMARFLGSSAFPGQQPVPPGFVLAAFSVAYIIARVLLAHLPEHWGRNALLVWPGLLGGGVLIAGILSRDYRLTAAAYVTGAFLWSSEYPAMLGRMAELEGPRFGAAMAVTGMAIAVGSAVGLVGIGWLANAVGESRMWIPMLVLACGFPCTGLGGWLWLWTGRTPRVP